MNLQVTSKIFRMFFSKYAGAYSSALEFSKNEIDKKGRKTVIEETRLWVEGMLISNQMLIAIKPLVEKIKVFLDDEKSKGREETKFFVNNCFDSLRYLKNFEFVGYDDDFLGSENMVSSKKLIQREPASGIANYLGDILKQLAGESKDIRNCFYKVPKTVDCLQISKENGMLAQDLARRCLSGLAVVVVAGGLGERLHYSGLKLELTNVLASNYSFLQTFFETVLALEKLLEKTPEQKSKKTAPRIPMVFVVNESIKTKINALLKSNNFFGGNERFVKVVVQRNFPCVDNRRGELAFTSDGRLKLKPCGHGDTHRALLKSDVLHWLKGLNTSHLLFLQDSNMQVLPSIPFIAATMEGGREFSQKIARFSDVRKNDLVDESGHNGFLKPAKFLFVAIEKLAGQKMGVLTNKVMKGSSNKAETQQTKKSIGNVEYHLHEKHQDLFRDSLNSFPVNTNTMMVEFSTYFTKVKENFEKLPYYFYPKKSNFSDDFLKSARLEQLSQDVSWFYDEEDVRILKLSNAAGFAAVKDSLTEKTISKSTNSFTCKNAEELYFSNIRSRLTENGNSFCYFDEFEFPVVVKKEQKTSSTIKKEIAEHNKSADAKSANDKFLLDDVWVDSRFKKILDDSGSDISIAKHVGPMPCIFFSPHYFFHSNLFEKIANNRFDAFSMLQVYGEGKLELSGLHFLPFSALAIYLCKGAYLCCNVEILRSEQPLNENSVTFANNLVEAKVKVMPTSRKSGYTGGGGSFEYVQANAYSLIKPKSEIELLFGYSICQKKMQTIRVTKPGNYRLLVNNGIITHEEINFKKHL